MPQYELILGLKPDLASEKREEVLGKIKTIVADNGGKVGETKSRGLSELAYPVNSFTEANLLIVPVEVEKEKVGILQKEFRTVKGVLRVMITREGVKNR